LTNPTLQDRTRRAEDAKRQRSANNHRNNNGLLECLHEVPSTKKCWRIFYHGSARCIADVDGPTYAFWQWPGALVINLTFVSLAALV
jgi:hypothetical protein